MPAPNPPSPIPNLGEPPLRERFQILNTASSRDAAALITRRQQVRLGNLVFAPFFTFLRVYGREGQWRHGIAGFVASLFSAYEVFVRYAKLWEHQHVKTTTPPPPQA